MGENAFFEKIKKKQKKLKKVLDIHGTMCYNNQGGSREPKTPV